MNQQDHLAELPITGYLCRFSRRPGEAFAVHVGMRQPGRFRTRLLRVISGDPNPSGPGMQFEDLSHVLDRSHDGRHQPIALGSYGIVDRGPERAADAACTWSVLVWSAAPDEPRCVLSETDGETEIAVFAGEHGANATLSWPGGSCSLATGARLAPRQWHRLWLSAEPGSGRVLLGQQRLGGDAVMAASRQDGLLLPNAGRILFAARHPAAPTDHFTGKLEAPAILAGFFEDAPIPADALAAWDFSRGIGTTEIIDTFPHACHGRLVNLPTRAVVGATWTGREMCWRHAPEDYAAIHFHDDDLDDCRWQPDFSWTVPEDLPSGAYALHLACGDGEDWLPLYVLPRRNGPFRKVAFLASTFTYQAYADHARGNADAAYRVRVAEWGAYPHNPDDFPIYGRSTYNRHRDGSGIALSSRLRPILTMRPGFLTFNDARGSGLRHYPADTHLLAWLEARGIDFDIVTDEDLHEEGAALLAPYQAVLTGSHPEYHTLATLDGLTAYLGAGGNLACLGGNGFYWRVAQVPAAPGIIELRRAEGGIRAWAAEPGEYYHQLDGQYGGLWRRNRRPPQMLTGVGFTVQGLFEATHFRRLPASHASEFAWMFEGIDGDIIGEYGLSGGGAAGFELDRADHALGTPENAVILARSKNPLPSFTVVSEELLSHISTVSGETPAALNRGEIVYFDTGAGGAVFAAGSITFCGSLWQPGAGFTGAVSRLLENVVRRFIKSEETETG